MKKLERKGSGGTAAYGEKGEGRTFAYGERDGDYYYKERAVGSMRMDGVGSLAAKVKAVPLRVEPSVPVVLPDVKVRGTSVVPDRTMSPLAS